MNNYPNDFHELVEICQSTYIGQGNPTSKILILGKECAIDIEDEQSKYKSEIIDNAYDWMQNCKGKPILNSVNPLEASQGQHFTKSKDGGTNATWYYYQKLYNLISRRENTEKLDFFEHCFTSELSEATAKYSTLVDDEHRKKSIAKRYNLFTMPFFQQFPIVIVAVGHYCRDYNINIEELFGVKWGAPTIDIGGKWINVHYNEGLKPKLLIHTNQLSVVSNDLLNKIAEICIEFIDHNKIIL